MTNYDADIARLEKELADKYKARNAYEALPLEYKVAEMLHNKHCRYNHEDACDWEYSSWDRYSGAISMNYGRHNYVKKAECVIRDLGDLGIVGDKEVLAAVRAVIG